MPALASSEQPSCFTRNAFLIKNGIIAAFFLHSADRHFLWTFDPRLTPNLYWYEYQTRDLAIERFNEFLDISKANGWTLATDGHRNYG